MFSRKEKKKSQVPRFRKTDKEGIFSQTCIVSIFENVSRCVFDKKFIENITDDV
jgi:hypothetical protein